jgi:hypothetical protein
MGVKHSVCLVVVVFVVVVVVDFVVSTLVV